MFAHLRGIPLSSIDSSVAEIIRMFNLEDHADKKSSSYSGGLVSTGISTPHFNIYLLVGMLVLFE